MRGAVLHGPNDLRFEERETPTIIKPTDAVIRISATCVCGSDLWPYRGLQASAGPTPMGHEYCGIVEEVGKSVNSVRPGQFVIGSFFASDNTCRHCRAGYQTSCEHREFVGGAQAPLLRIPLADGTLVGTPEMPPNDLMPSLLAPSDVMGTGWFAAQAANVKPEATVTVVGDGADSVLECVGTQESMTQAIECTRPGGSMGYVGVPHGVELDGQKLFFAHVHLHGGPAPVRRLLPRLIEQAWDQEINPGKVFDLTLPLDQVAEGYRAMDERRAIKVLLRP